jgi:2-haloacid dehalogenase
MQKCMGRMRGSRIDRNGARAHARIMARREFLQLLSSVAALGLLGSCTPPKPPIRTAMPTQRTKIRAICFDLFTLFDPRSVVAIAQTLVPERAHELCEAWRVRQFEYSWIRVASGQYADFRVVTMDALTYAAKAQKVELTEAARDTLVDAYSRLAPWPDTRAALLAWKQAGLRLAPLSNYTPAMLAQLLANAGLTELFDAQISTHPARTFKPDPRAYALGPSTLGLRREEIAFAAFGGWDAAGAKWFAFPTFWVNRLGVPEEILAPGPDATGPTLAELAEFVRAW